ncbi:MAG: membrane protein insertion efficiency factor YidD [Clostridiales bacterium]|nr:membrane protein insertion efficiency factor YidD [Clostridiales bacterium]
MIKWLLLQLIKVYQRFVSPLTRPRCRFMPTCSEYSRLAIKKYGVCKGVAKSVWRIMRCNPFCKGGVDMP